jgi:hypothetical protein
MSRLLTELRRVLDTTSSLTPLSEVDRPTRILAERTELLWEIAQKLGGSAAGGVALLDELSCKTSIIKNITNNIKHNENKSYQERDCVVDSIKLLVTEPPLKFPKFNKRFDLSIGKKLYARCHQEQVLVERQGGGGRRTFDQATAIENHFLEASYPIARTTDDGVNLRIMHAGTVCVNL